MTLALGLDPTKIWEAASKITTWQGLVGIGVATLLIIFQQIISRKIFPQLTQAVAGEFWMRLLNGIFALAAIALVGGFVLALFGMSVAKPPGHGPDPSPSPTPTPSLVGTWRGKWFCTRQEADCKDGDRIWEISDPPDSKGNVIIKARNIDVQGRPVDDPNSPYIFKYAGGEMVLTNSSGIMRVSIGSKILCGEFSRYTSRDSIEAFVKLYRD